MSELTPKKKAEEIYCAMINAGAGMISAHLAKKCSMICIEEVIASSDHAGGWDDYWNAVKREIKKL